MRRGAGVEGTAFGRYQLIELLGRGGMGEVWRAFDTGTDRHVAIKVLPAQLAHDSEFEARFRREANLAAGLDSPHIVPIYDYGEIDDRLFVAMRLVKGHNLAAALASGPMAPERAVAIVEQVAKALRAAHSAGLVHRDVKPANILIDEFGDAYLIDFGIARAVADTGMTGTGTTIGTWAYMAPERFRGEPLGAAVDVYALSCVLYECLTGTVPFPGTDVASVASGHLFTPSPRPSLVISGLPSGLDQVIAVGLAKDPAHRYPGTYELAVAARAALTHPVPQAVSSPSATHAPAQVAPTTLAPASTAVLPDASGYRPTTLSATGPTEIVRTADSTGMQAPGQQPASGGRRRRLPLALVAAAVVVTVVAVVAGITLVSNRESPSASPSEPDYGQTVLPLVDLRDPQGLAIDAGGSIYVADIDLSQQIGDSDYSQVLMLAAGSGETEVLPFTGIAQARGVAVDATGTVYVTTGTTQKSWRWRSAPTIRLYYRSTPSCRAGWRSIRPERCTSPTTTPAWCPCW